MDDSQPPRKSDAAASRKRRSSILKSQCPPRTPFSDLEFNVATPTNTTKSRRVSFSRRTGVAEFVTNDATTTWKNFYEEHNKSLESSNNDSGLKQSQQTVAHLGKRIFDQQFEEVEAFDFGNTIDHMGRQINSSMNNVNFAPLECTIGDKTLAPTQQNFELSALTANQSKFFGDDLLAPIIGETSGRIDINLSAVNSISIKDDLDEIEKDLQRSHTSSNVVCRGPFSGNASEYIEVDLNVTNVAMRNDDDMSITDTIHSPKVQEIPKNSTITNDKVDDWVSNKENIVLNPYVAPKESINFALNEEPNKVLVFDGKRLTIQTDSDDVTTKQQSDFHNSLSSSHGQRKIIVLNVNDDLPNFIDDANMFKVHERNRSAFSDLSMTQSLPEKIDVDEGKTVCDNLGEISVTECIADNVILQNKTAKQTTVVFDNDAAEISMTQALPQNILISKDGDKRKTILFDDADGNISITQALPKPKMDNGKIYFEVSSEKLEVPDGSNDKSAKRKTIVYNDDAGNISVTQALPAHILISNNAVNLNTITHDDITKSSDLNENAEKRRTIVFDNANVSITQAIPALFLSADNKRKTIIFDDNTADVSVTQVVPANLIQDLIKEKRKTIDYDNSEGNIAITQAVPNDKSNKRKTIVYNDDAGNISVTQALPAHILISNNAEAVNLNTITHDDITKSSDLNENAEKRRTIVFDNANVSITQAIPALFLSADNKRKTIIFDDNTADISVTQVVPANLIQDLTKEKRKTIVYDNSESNISITQAVPSVVLSDLLNCKSKLKTIVYDSDKGIMSMTQTVPSTFLINNDNNKNSDKRKTIMGDNDNGDISNTLAIPTNCLITGEKMKTIIFEDHACNVSVTQAIPTNIQECLLNTKQAGVTQTNELLDESTSKSDKDNQCTNKASLVFDKDEQINYTDHQALNVFNASEPEIRVEYADNKDPEPHVVVPIISSNNFVHIQNIPELPKIVSVLDESNSLGIKHNISKPISVEMVSLPNGLSDKSICEEPILESAYDTMDIKSQDIFVYQTSTKLEFEKSQPDVAEDWQVNIDTEANNATQADIQSLTSGEGVTANEVYIQPNRNILAELLNMSYTSIVLHNDKMVPTVDSSSDVRSVSSNCASASSKDTYFYVTNDSNSDILSDRPKLDSPNVIKKKATNEVNKTYSKSPGTLKKMLHKLAKFTHPSIDKKRKEPVSLSTEDVFTNISRAHSMLLNIEMEDDSEHKDAAINVNGSLSTTARNDVVKKLHFEDETLTDTPNENLTPLRKSSLGESSVSSQLKSRVIPSYLKDVSDGVKQLMLDLIKPNDDETQPIDTQTNFEPQMASAQIQANLVASSQIDIAPSDMICTDSLNAFRRNESITKMPPSPENSATTTESQSTILISKTSESDNNESQQDLTCESSTVLHFDEDVPLNNVMLNPVARRIPRCLRKNYFKTDEAVRSETSPSFMTNVNKSKVKFDVDFPPSLQCGDASLDALKPIDSTKKNKNLKDTTVNTVIAMKTNKELLENVSALNLKDNEVTPRDSIFSNELKALHIIDESKRNTESAGDFKSRVSDEIERETDVFDNKSRTRVNDKNQQEANEIVNNLKSHVNDNNQQETNETANNIKSRVNDNNHREPNETAKDLKSCINDENQQGANETARVSKSRVSFEIHRISGISVNESKPQVNEDIQQEANQTANKIKSQVNDNNQREPRETVKDFKPCFKDENQPEANETAHVSKSQLSFEMHRISDISVNDLKSQVSEDIQPEANETADNLKSRVSFEIQPKENETANNVNNEIKPQTVVTADELMKSVNVDEINQNTDNTSQSKKRLYSPNVREDKSINVDTTPKPVNKLKKLSASPIQNISFNDDTMKSILKKTSSLGKSESETSNSLTNQDARTLSEDLILDEEMISESVNSISASRLMYLNQKSAKDIHGIIKTDTDMVEKISKLSFMSNSSKNLCEWGTNTGDTWTFQLLHSQIRLIVRLGCVCDEYGEVKVTKNTQVLDVSVEEASEGRHNQISALCVSTAAKVMCVYISHGCYEVASVPGLLRQCAAVSRIAVRWGRAMKSAMAHLAFTVHDDVIKLHVANVPLKSVWEVAIHMTICTAKKVPFPIVDDVKITKIVGVLTEAMECDAKRSLKHVPADWGNVPRAIWKVFRHLKDMKTA